MEYDEIVLAPAPESRTNPVYTDADGTGLDEPVVARQQLFRYAQDMGRLVRDRAWAQAELRNARRETLFRLAITVEMSAHDGPAAMLRIGLFSALVAHTLGMPDEYCEILCIAAPLRDIGLLGLDRRADAKALQEHPVLGAAILGGSHAIEMQMAEDVALTHHERYDGSGYPRGLEGADIPLSGRIVAAVEMAERQLSAATLRAESNPDSILESVQARLGQAAGSAIDPCVADATIACLASYPRVEEAVARVLAEGPAQTYAERLPALWREVLAGHRRSAV